MLVGGFGQNPYLRNYLKAEIPPKIEVIQVVNGWTAMVRGALTKALADTAPSLSGISIESRVARKHYGMLITTPFEPGVYDIKKSGYPTFELMQYSNHFKALGLFRRGVCDRCHALVYQ